MTSAWAAERAAAAALLLGIAVAARADGALPMLTPLAGPEGTPPAPWKLAKLPKQSKPVTSFSIVALDGEPALRVDADKSYGTLVHVLPADAPHGRTLAWRWRVEQPVAGADLRQRSGDDTAVKVCALFGLPMDKVPALDRAWLRAARKASGSALPAAAVCYVWDSQLPLDTALPNAFTRRVRYLVLRSSESPPGSWQQEQRDLDADFLKLFGDESDTVPRLAAIAIGGDADNTKGTSRAYVADLVLHAEAH